MGNSVYIFGAGPGLGRALGDCFAREGFAVGLVARNGAGLAALSAEIRPLGAAVATAEADVANPVEVAAAFDELAVAIGAPRVVIYNAFLRATGGPSVVSPEWVAEAFRVNVLGAIHVAQAALPRLAPAGARTILFTGGGAAIDPWPDLAPLGIAKAGVRNYAMNLAAEQAPRGIHVATVTICGHIARGTAYDPDRIAGEYLALHQEDKDHWRSEVVIR